MSQELSKININVNDPQQYYDLLTYYRSKMGEFEKERFEWLTKVEEIRIQYEDKHQLEWELVKRRDEVNDLQKSISEAKVMLFEERQARLKLQKENDALKVRELEDRKKIAELMAMLDPIQEHVVLQKDLRPEVTTKFQTETLAINNKMHSIGQGKCIMKTVYMPNEQLSAISLENEQLKKQLEQAHQLLNQQFSALREELRIKDAEEEIRKKDDKNKLNQLQQKLQKVEKQNVDLVKDYYHLKQKFQNKDRQAQEEQEVLRLKNKKLQLELDTVTKKTSLENKAAVELLEKKSEEYNKKFRNEIRSKDNQLNIIKEQYSQVQNIYIDRIRQLEENLSKLIDKYQSLEKRRALEIEGFKNDIKKLNQRFKDYERVNENTKPIQEDELQKYKQEAEQLKQQLAKETGNIYSSGKKSQTLKQQPKPIKQAAQTIKSKSQKPNRNIQKAKKEVVHQSDSEPEDDNVSESMPLQDLEDIQRQLDELERQMDQAKKN